MRPFIHIPDPLAMFEEEERRQRMERNEHLAAMWRQEHRAAFIAALDACTDVQTLRALAHRLGYKEGA